MNPDEVHALADRIIEADRLFANGRFDECMRAARQLFEEVESLPNPPGEQWRAELLGLIGRSALQLTRIEDALHATRDALRKINELHDDRLSPLREALRENLLTVLAALENPATDDVSARPTHRELRAQIVGAQKMTDRHRYNRSIEMLEPLATRLRELIGADIHISAEEPLEPADARVLYLPKVLGLLGFNWFYRGELQRSRDLTEQAIDVSRLLRDRDGERVYKASLAWIEREIAHDASP